MTPYSYPGLKETPEMLKKLAEEKELTPEDVLRAVSSVTWCTIPEIMSKSRRSVIVYARNLSYLFMNDYCFMSGRQISKYFGRERTTVDKNLRELRANTSPALQSDIAKVIEVLFCVFRVS